MKLKPNGEVLKWAREIDRKAAQEGADAIPISIETFLNWENNAEEIGYGHLEKLSKLYKRPIAFFFLPEPPKETLITPEFRTFDSIEVDSLSEKTILALRKSKYNIKLYKDLIDEMDESYSFDFPVARDLSNPELFAAKVRQHLKISDDIHTKLKDKNAALRFWITSVEEKGLLVFQYSLPERGFCLQGEKGLPPAIVLSSAEEPTARTFTVFHELAHLLISKNAQKVSYSILEKFCNHFAGAFLLPKSLLLESDNYTKYLEEFSDFWLARVAGEFKVSWDVVLRRLLILEKITQKFHDTKIAEIKSTRDKRLKKLAEKEQDGFLPPAKKSFLNTGITMSSKLFEARERGFIGTAELVRNFQTTAHTLNNIKTEISAAKKIYAE